MESPVATPRGAAPETLPATQRRRVTEIFARQRAAARRSWGIAERRARLRRLAAWVDANRGRIEAACWQDFRKPAAEVELTEVYPILHEVRFALRHLRRWTRPRRVPRAAALLTARARIRYEPKGVVLILSPWNYPINLTLGPLVSALAAGNRVSIKPSEITPRCSALVAEAVTELFPEEEVACFEGAADVATALLEQPFDHVFFTGSTRVGRLVMEAASRHLTSVTLELGGKSPVLVDETADLEDAAAKIVAGKFINAGQTCIAPDYVLVHRDREEELLRLLAGGIAAAYGRTPEARRTSPDYARIVDARHTERLRAVLRESLAAGAQVTFGGACEEGDRFLEPTVVRGVGFDSPLMREEIFGPLLPVLTFDDLETAIESVRRLDEPLALYVFSRDHGRAERVLGELPAGGGCVNDVATHFIHSRLPFGGVKTSGLGSSHGFFGFRAFSHERAVLYGSRLSPVTLLGPPYTRLKRRLIDLAVRYL